MTTPSETVGFIGLGFMGHGMAKNIVDKGYPLTVMGRSKREAIEDLTRRGAVEVKTAAEVAARSTIVFLCVTGSTDVEAIVRGENGLAGGLKPGSIIVDCSTADPNSTLALAAEFAPRGVHFVDAPLGRTPKEAWEGTLDTMVGASEAVFSAPASSTRRAANPCGASPSVRRTAASERWLAICSPFPTAGIRPSILPRIRETVLSGTP